MQTEEKQPVCPLRELDLFESRSRQNSITSTSVTEHRPVSVLDSKSILTFVLTTPEDEYIQLNDILFYLKLKIEIEKKDNVAVIKDDWNNVYPENNLLHSLFKQVDCEINGKLITSATQTYPYKAYFATKLGFTEDARHSHLSASMYYPDNDKRKKLISPNSASKIGKVFDLMGKLHIDLAYQPKLLIGGSEIKINLVPHNEEFYMRSATTITPTLSFIDAALYVPRSKISPLVLQAHRLALRKATAKYPITRSEVKSFTVNSGTLNTSIDNIVIGQTPRRAFVAMVTNTAFNGAFNKNPFDFKHFNVNYVATHIDGNVYPSKPYTPDFTNKLYMREYLGLYEALNQLSTDSISKIQHDKFASSTTIFGFNFAPDLSEGLALSGHINENRKGTMRLELGFKEALSETINVLIFLEFDNLIQINETREVITDYI